MIEPASSEPAEEKVITEQSKFCLLPSYCAEYIAASAGNHPRSIIYVIISNTRRDDALSERGFDLKQLGELFRFVPADQRLFQAHASAFPCRSRPLIECNSCWRCT